MGATLDPRTPVLVGADWMVKRAFDLLVSGAVIVVGLPLWLLIALAIKLDSRGPVLYVDRRIGVGESEFGMLKFRTMSVGAAALQEELEAANEGSWGSKLRVRIDYDTRPIDTTVPGETATSLFNLTVKDTANGVNNVTTNLIFAPLSSPSTTSARGYRSATRAATSATTSGRAA